MHGPIGNLLESTVSHDHVLERAFEKNLPDLSRLAFRVAYSVLRQREDAEDVAQEGLVRAFRKLKSLREHDRLRSWLARICWRLALDHQRAARRRASREGLAGEPAAVTDGEELALAGERRRRLLAAVDALPEKLRIVLVLANLEGHGVRDVASLLSLPEGTVKSRLHLARRRLLENLS